MVKMNRMCGTTEIEYIFRVGHIYCSRRAALPRFIFTIFTFLRIRQRLRGLDPVKMGVKIGEDG